MTQPQAPSVEIDLPGSVPALALAVPLGTGLKAQASGHLILLGWAIKPVTAIAGANVALYTGGAPAGQLVGVIDTATDSCPPFWAGPGGIDCPAGLYVYVNISNVIGVIYFRPVT